MLLRLHHGVRTLDIAVQILCIALQTEVEGVVLIRLITADQSHICCVTVVAQAVVLKICDEGRESCFDACLARMDGHNVALAPVDTELYLAHRARVGTQEKVAVGEELSLLRRSSFRVEAHSRLIPCFLCDDVHDTADCVRAVLCTRRTLGDLDALDVLRTETHDLICCTIVLGKISHDGLTVHEDQRMAWLCAANRDADAPHRVHRA